MQSCKTGKKGNTIISEVKKGNEIEIITENMDFQMPDTISSGWNTLRYKNQSPQTHFFIFEKYPEGKTLADAKSQVIPLLLKWFKTN